MDFDDQYLDTVSPVMAACCTGNVQQLRHLLRRGRAVDVRDNRGWLPTHAAAHYGHAACLQAVLTAIQRAAQHGSYLPSVDIDSAAHDGSTALMLACRSHSLRRGRCVRVLLENGADVTAVALDGCSALHAALSVDDTPLLRQLIECGERQLDLPASGGRDDDVSDSRLCKFIEQRDPCASLLVHAISAGVSGDTVHLLVTHGASVSCSGDDLVTPLMLAVQHGRRDVIDVLRRHAGGKFTPQMINAQDRHDCGLMLRLLRRTDAERERVQDVSGARGAFSWREKLDLFETLLDGALCPSDRELEECMSDFLLTGDRTALQMLLERFGDRLWESCSDKISACMKDGELWAVELLIAHRLYFTRPLGSSPSPTRTTIAERQYALLPLVIGARSIRHLVVALRLTQIRHERHHAPSLFHFQKPSTNSVEVVDTRDVVFARRLWGLLTRTIACSAFIADALTSGSQVQSQKCLRVVLDYTDPRQLNHAVVCAFVCTQVLYDFPPCLQIHIVQAHERQHNVQTWRAPESVECRRLCQLLRVAAALSPRRYARHHWSHHDNCEVADEWKLVTDQLTDQPPRLTTISRHTLLHELLTRCRHAGTPRRLLETLGNQVAPGVRRLVLHGDASMVQAVDQLVFGSEFVSKPVDECSCDVREVDCRLEDAYTAARQRMLEWASYETICDF